MCSYCVPCVCAPPADPMVALDVVAANRQYMEESEELYDALTDCHWPALEPPGPTAAAPSKTQ